MYIVTQPLKLGATGISVQVYQSESDYQRQVDSRYWFRGERHYLAIIDVRKERGVYETAQWVAALGPLGSTETLRAINRGMASARGYDALVRAAMRVAGRISC